MRREALATRSAEPIGRVLERTLRAQGLSRRLDRAVPAQVWREAVGCGIAERAQPTVLNAGVLHVLVEDHRWRDQLDAARVLLIERVNARLGRPLVRELRFGLAHAGSLSQGGPAAAAPAAPTEPDEVACVPGAAQLAPELRDALLGAAGAALRSAARARGG
jgi:predicted nucleic acid-binding Zn ribbon protein